MCFCVVGNCCWWNCCGMCAGCNYAYLCFGCWCCKPDDFAIDHNECCVCCQRTGFGGNLICFGYLCCAPRWLLEWVNQKQ